MKGKVYLVGAGSGDYKLMTLKGLECIRKSDVIVYDRLANIDYLKEAKENGDREKWHEIVNNYNLYLKLKPFKAAKELINDYILYIADNKSAKILM